MSDETLSNTPDYAMANRFLSALTGSPGGYVTFQFFSDRDKKNCKVATFRNLKRGPVYALLYKKQREGCGVYVMINRGDGKGRRAKNVKEVLSLFIDLDGEPMDPAVGLLKPHVIVESSPGRFHLYWLVADCALGQFKPLQQAIAAKFHGDRKCVDLCRVLRVPGFYHMKNEPVMTRLLEVNDFPKYTTQQVVDGLGLELTTTVITVQQKQDVEEPAPSISATYEYIVPDTGEVIDLTAWAVKNPRFDVVAAINPERCIGEVVDGKRHIQCPFEREHTDTSPDLATFVANALPPQYKSFNICCMHDHCAGRDRLAFLKIMLEQRWLSADLVQAPEPLRARRPGKVYFPVNDIAASLEWSTLKPDEYRIALHLMAHAWKSEDGTLPDNDWKLSRLLSITEDEWRAYRETLTRTGWLSEKDGRLFNSIVKREFDNAQTALMNAIASGQRGGKITQRNKRGESSDP